MLGGSIFSMSLFIHRIQEGVPATVRKYLQVSEFLKALLLFCLQYA